MALLLLSKRPQRTVEKFDKRAAPPPFVFFALREIFSALRAVLLELNVYLKKYLALCAVLLELRAKSPQTHFFRAPSEIFEQEAAAPSQNGSF
jgi:hypothetical protein